MARESDGIESGSSMNISPMLTQKIRQIVPDGKVLSELGDLYCYSYDATRMSFLPDLVVEPTSARQVAEVVRAGRSRCRAGSFFP